MLEISHEASLKRAMKEGALLPLVGAGVSMAVKSKQGKAVFPSWTRLLENASEYMDEEDKDFYLGFVRRGRLLEAAKEAKGSIVGETWYEFLEDQFNPDLDTCDQTSFDLARAVWKVSKQIITLNYDRVLEHVAPASNARILRNSSTAPLKQMMTASDNSMIWHLHGHIDEPDKLVLTPQSYEFLYGEDSKYEAAIQTFKQVVATRSLLFIGSSMEDTEILAEMMVQHELFNGNSKVHFVLVHKDHVALMNEKLKAFNTIKLIPFSGYGQPLIDTLHKIADLGNTMDNESNNQPSPPQISNVQPALKIAYLSAKPFDQTLGNFAAIEKEIKKSPPFDMSSFPLTEENLHSLDGYQYLVLVCHIKKNKLIIENEWCGSTRMPLSEFEQSIDAEELKGVIVICDELPSQQALSRIALPMLFIPELCGSTSLVKKIWFQLFKKQSFTLFEEVGALVNTSQFDLGEKVKQFNGLFMNHTRRLPMDISKDEVAKFVGRQQDLEECSRKLFQATEQNECLTILGTGGLGKTSLVKKLAFEYNERGLFDNVTFIDCEHLVNYKQFHWHIASAFDLEDAVNVIEHIEENVEFQQGHRLIIIDNAESLLQLEDRALVLDLIRQMNEYATLLVTSRETLGLSSESTYQLRDFVAEESLALFEQKSKQTYSERERVYLKEKILKELLDHNPLAISLVASTMVRGKNLKELKEDLDNNFFDVVKKAQSEGIEPTDKNIDRRYSIYNCIDYSYKKLPPVAKEALVKLSYFPDGIDLGNFKKLTGKDAKARGSAPINDTTIKLLQDKSLVQTSQQFIRLHPLVARFAKGQMTPSDESSYIKVIFDYQLNYVLALSTLSNDYSVEKQIRAKSITAKQARNFGQILASLTPELGENAVLNYIHHSVHLFSTIEEYSIMNKYLTQSKDNFKENKNLYKYIKLVILKNNYYMGDFKTSLRHFKHLLPLKECLELDLNNNVEVEIFRITMLVYGNEGAEYALTKYYTKGYFIGPIYDGNLVHLGVFNPILAKLSVTNFNSLFVRIACGEATIADINADIDTLHPKAHIQYARLLTLKSKYTELSDKEISRIVIVNPYTKGVKLLLQAKQSSELEEANHLFSQALQELKHTKFAYTEALLAYATWIKKHQLDGLIDVLNEGLECAQKHHYRYLQHCLINLKNNTHHPYDESQYPFPDNENFIEFITKCIQHCKRTRKR
ncbi:AAA family ATPase [Vibrio sp. S9_S30]|uniref:SIR2 family protein n=1 Tax=Vibrio sp. S9_S30 TaxID=2720226 RepID=UPI0016803139|nr:SIR2 family protein [Vibrio sp. S9_S30]MBD1559822.1 AAA family ATPase [Vibrio sp. S9_S30]